VTCVRDCRTALPLASESARGIFTEHFLEHLDYYEEAPKFLKECRRILRPGGTLRVIVPDGAKYLEAYCSGDLAAMQSISPFMKWDRTCKAVPLSIVRDVVPFRTKMEVVNFHFRQAGEHRFSYDFETLSELLEECGFESIVEMPFRKSDLPDLEIDNEVRSPRAWWWKLPSHSAVRPEYRERLESVPPARNSCGRSMQTHRRMPSWSSRPKPATRGDYLRLVLRLEAAPGFEPGYGALQAPA
jgi:SAM-dependent methyltransferase